MCESGFSPLNLSKTKKFSEVVGHTQSVKLPSADLMIDSLCLGKQTCCSHFMLLITCKHIFYISVLYYPCNVIFKVVHLLSSEE
jgi:hypothetical protein